MSDSMSKYKDMQDAQVSSDNDDQNIALIFELLGRFRVWDADWRWYDNVIKNGKSNTKKPISAGELCQELAKEFFVMKFEGEPKVFEPIDIKLKDSYEVSGGRFVSKDPMELAKMVLEDVTDYMSVEAQNDFMKFLISDYKRFHETERIKAEEGAKIAKETCDKALKDL